MIPAVVLGVLLSLLSTLGLGLSTACWWPFYTIGILSIAGILGAAGWAISRAFIPNNQGGPSWWETNQWRVLQGALAALVVLVSLWLVSLWAKKLAPVCGVGCVGAVSSRNDDMSRMLQCEEWVGKGDTTFTVEQDKTSKVYCSKTGDGMMASYVQTGTETGSYRLETLEGDGKYRVYEVSATNETVVQERIHRIRVLAHGRTQTIKLTVF